MEDSYEGRKVYKYNFRFEEPDHSGINILQAGESSSCARGILISLASINGPIRQVKIRVYKADTDVGEFTNAHVEYRDESSEPWVKAEWRKSIMDRMPPAQKVTIRGREEWDDTERLRFLESVSKHIAEKKLDVTGLHYEGNETQEEPNHQEYEEQQQPDYQPQNTQPPHPAETNQMPSGGEVYGPPKQTNQAPEKFKPKPATPSDFNLDDIDDDLPF
jgi:hypothetical protein